MASMKYFPLMLLISQVVPAEIYKCMSYSGVITFTGKPCVDGVAQEFMTETLNSQSWLDQLHDNKPAYIDIIRIRHKDGDVFIQYEYTGKRDANEFLRLVGGLSQMGVTILKLWPSDKAGVSRAELKASDKPNRLPYWLSKHSATIRY